MLYFCSVYVKCMSNGSQVSFKYSMAARDAASVVLERGAVAQGAAVGRNVPCTMGGAVRPPSQ